MALAPSTSIGAAEWVPSVITVLAAEPVPSSMALTLSSMVLAPSTSLVVVEWVPPKWVPSISSMASASFGISVATWASLVASVVSSSGTTAEGRKVFIMDGL
ncbi:unnamed protein product [Cuscuta campestris]|uniref:Uncharacterized protein n=1 Tax=Cuscuta campestris TaxID=132261 RepID=A0A484M3M9_9ASTE|nr:unnamed protein product [Cuscuta campestris]